LRSTGRFAPSRPVHTALILAVVVGYVPSASAYVALMAGQQARPLNGTFNKVPVLHSNQPEEVEGPGILINTAPGSAVAENGVWLRNAEYTFNGEFGVHMHHKYLPPYRRQIAPGSRRTELTLGLIFINPGNKPVRIKFQKGAVRNSFEAPYLADNLMGVKPLGPRPWNTGPGDATAVQMLRGRLDSRLSDAITLPPRSRVVLFQKPLPALGIANALIKGRSDGPFQMAVVAASNPQSDADIVAVLDSGRLAPGRVYLRRIAEINNRQIFSRVGGVAIGDAYQADLKHDLNRQGPLHVPFTSTHRHHFGTREVQVNPLASRMLDSSLDNVGTYGVRFDVDLNLVGNGAYELVMSHPVPAGGLRPFTAFRGSMQVRTDDGLQEIHVGLRSGQSVALTTLNLKPGVVNPVRVSMVYPADATPGHLLSVVPSSQLARVESIAKRVELARLNQTAAPRPMPPSRPADTGLGAAQPAPVSRRAPVAPPPAVAPAIGAAALLPPKQLRYQAPIRPKSAVPLQPQRAPVPQRSSSRSVAVQLFERYQEALEAQQQQLHQQQR
jgi:hypothetical protein